MTEEIDINELVDDIFGAAESQYSFVEFLQKIICDEDNPNNKEAFKLIQTIVNSEPDSLRKEINLTTKGKK